MTITQLEYLIAVSKYGSFTKASEKCYVTQPTLSMQVQNLEEELKIKIFIRGTKPIQLTEVGEKVIEQANIIIREALKMKDIVSYEKNYIGGEFKLGIIPTITTILPIFLKKFNKKYPNVNLKIIELNSDTLINQILTEDIDGGITSTPLNHDNINEIPLYYEPFVAYIPTKSKLSEIDNLKIEDLEYSSILTLKERHCFAKQTSKIFKNINQNFDFNIGNFETLIQLSDQGFGITLLPILYSKTLSEEKIKKLKYFDEPEPARQVSIIYSKNKLKSPIINALSNLIEHISRTLIKPNDVKIISPK